MYDQYPMQITDFDAALARARSDSRGAMVLMLLIAIATSTLILAPERVGLRVPPAADLAISGIATVLGILAMIEIPSWVRMRSMRRHGLLCAECGKPLVGRDYGRQTRATGNCPYCGTQVLAN